MKNVRLDVVNFLKAEPQLITIDPRLNCCSKIALVLLILVVLVQVAHVPYIFVNLVASVHYAVGAWVSARNSILLAALLVKRLGVGLKSANKLGASLPTIHLGLSLAWVVGFVMETIWIMGIYELTRWFLSLLWLAQNLYLASAYCPQEQTTVSGCVGFRELQSLSSFCCAWAALV